MTPEERFWAKVDVRDADECWLWQGACNSLGYGSFWFAGRAVGAHRFAYELLVDLIPNGLVIDHLCRDRRCVNPRHLEPVTQRENVLRGDAPAASHAVLTYCIHGHEFTPENTKTRQDKRSKWPSRICRECARRAGRERMRRSRARTRRAGV